MKTKHNLFQRITLINNLINLKRLLALTVNEVLAATVFLQLSANWVGKHDIIRPMKRFSGLFIGTFFIFNILFLLEEITTDN